VIRTSTALLLSRLLKVEFTPYSSLSSPTFDPARVATCEFVDEPTNLDFLSFTDAALGHKVLAQSDITCVR